MTRAKQINKAANVCRFCQNEHDIDCFSSGARWADVYPIIAEEKLEQLIETIKSGESKTVTEYSNKPELVKAFNDGQISVLKLLIEWINYNQYSEFD